MASVTPDLSATTTSAPSPPPPDPLISTIHSLLDPAIATTTQKMSAVFLVQQELSGELDRLVAELHRYLEDTEPPPLRDVVVKLADVRKRLMLVNNRLSKVQERVGGVYLLLSRMRIPAG